MKQFGLDHKKGRNDHVRDLALHAKQVGPPIVIPVKPKPRVPFANLPWFHDPLAPIILYTPNSKGSGLRAIMHLRDPHCHWCGRHTHLPLKTSSGIDPVKPKEDMATIDHFFSRKHPWRNLLKGFVVLACNACNKRRNIEETKVGVVILELEG